MDVWINTFGGIQSYFQHNSRKLQIRTLTNYVGDLSFTELKDELGWLLDTSNFSPEHFQDKIIRLRIIKACKKIIIRKETD